MEGINKKTRKIFLDDLPRGGSTGVGKNNINWSKSINYNVRFIYDGIDDYIKIVKYHKKHLTIKYNKKEYTILTDSFINCKLNKIIKKEIPTITSGTVLKDVKRNLVITNMEYRKEKDGRNRKWYKYTCYKCGWTEGWIQEGNLLKEIGCSCCYGRTVVEGINDIPTTDPWMVKYFQGGYNEAKLYNANSGKIIFPICPDCGRIKDKGISPNTIYTKLSIFCTCSDNIPYPEKLMFSVLEQLYLKFQTQLSKTTFKWIGKYYYDFYFEYNNEHYIIETHGNQHYENSFSTIDGAKPLEEVQQNDRIKKELALKNGIKKENYIIIDCRKSELEFIKQNILKDKTLKKLFDLSKIDWLKAEEFSLSNRVKEACMYKRNKPDLNCKDISKLMNVGDSTIRAYLKKGNEFGWCDYNVDEEMKKNGKSTSKPVEIFKDNISLGIFPSCKELERQSEKYFGTKLDSGNISKVCNGKRVHCHGYTFIYSC